MNKSVVLIGVGEMGGIFARGFLRLGYSVLPVIRSTDINQMAHEIVNPELVLVAVGEADLQAVLESMPANWRDSLVLLQNELLPKDWLKHDLDPTVISVWFEKKKGQDAKVLIPSPVYGAKSRLIHDVLQAVDIPCKMLNSDEELLFELVVKNVYIVTTNISGLKAGGTVGELWSDHRDLANKISHEVISIQQALTRKSFNASELIDAMVVAFNGDPDHKCMGRSAPARLQRALDQAQSLSIDIPEITQISANI
jgi:hypothetical protein